MALSAEDIPFKVLVMSKGRADQIPAHPLLSAAYVCVDTEDEQAKYVEAIERAGKSAHSVHVLGGHDPTLGAARRRALDELWRREEPFVVMVDDDFEGFVSRMRFRSVGYRNVDDLLSIFWQSYVTAKDIPTGLFGYGTLMSVMSRGTNLPFGALNGSDISAQAMGILDRDLRFDPSLSTGDDIDLSLQCLKKYRFFLKDMRYSLVAATKTSGGVANVRTSVQTKKIHRRLTEKWGTDIMRLNSRYNNEDGFDIRYTISIR